MSKNTPPRIGPVIIGSRPEPRKLPKSDHPIKSNLTHVKHQGLDYIYELESYLLKHPMLLLPYLRDYLPPKICRSVFALLEPGQPLTRSDPRKLIHISKRAKIKDDNSDYCESKEDPRKITLDELINLQENWLIQSQEESTDPELFVEYPNLKKKTYEFCDFVAAMDGSENDNPEPTTLASLFAGTHEAQPPISTPIQLIDARNLPVALTESVGVVPRILTGELPLEEQLKLPGFLKSPAAERQEKKYEKLRYGVWYIPAKKWNNLDKEITTKEKAHSKIQDELKRKQTELNVKMLHSHGFKSFKEYIKRSNCRLPRFMRISEEAEQDETKPNHIKEKNKFNQI